MKQLLTLFLLLAGIISSFSQTDVDLKLNLQKGDSYRIENKIVSETVQDIMGEKQLIKKNEFFSYLFTVLNLPSENSYYIQVTYKRFKTIVEAQGNVNVIDTDSIADDSPLNQFFSSIIGKSFYYEVDKTGEVLRVDSLNNFFKHDLIEELDENTKLMLKKQFGEEAIKQSASLTKFSKQKVNLGKSWGFQDTTTINILNVVNQENRLLKVTADTYKIKKSSEIFTDKNKSLSINNIFIQYDMKGKSVGEDILFRNSCMIKESISTQHVSGTAGMKYSEDSETAFTWPIEITNIISVNAYKIEDK